MKTPLLRRSLLAACALVLLAQIPSPARATSDLAYAEQHEGRQAHEPAQAPGAEQAGEAEEDVPYSEVMMHHITDGWEIEVPAFNEHLGHKIDLREVFGDWTVRIGEHTIDLTPSKLVLFLWLAALVLIVLYGFVSPRAYDERGVPKGLNNLLEVFVIFVRDEIAIANIGKKDGPRYVPYLCSLFLFILVMNFAGLIPYGSTATGNLAVTGGLAVLSFILMILAGMRAHGVMGYWLALVPSGVPKALWPLMWPIEFLGLFTKPFALTVRLFANMTAGHVVILSLLGLIFVQKSLVWAPVSIPFALFIYLLEILVALLQAYIFAMLTALFIGLASHDH